MRKVVLYQGIEGSYSDMAAHEFFSNRPDNEQIDYVGRNTFSEAINGVHENEALTGFLPVENSTYGDVVEVWSLLINRNVAIIGEHYFPVHHCLLAKPGVKLEDITEVRSHPQALGQCSRFLEDLNAKNKYGLKIVQWYDTAGSAKDVAKLDNNNVAAIASKLAADIYGLNVLVEGIEDTKKNVTRFLHIRPGAWNEGYLREGPIKMTMLTDLDAPKPGTFIDFLTAVQRRPGDASVRLSKVVSKPIPEFPFEYHFWIELDGIPTLDRVKYVIREGERTSTKLSVLGVYNQAKINV